MVCGAEFLSISALPTATETGFSLRDHGRSGAGYAERSSFSVGAVLAMAAQEVAEADAHGTETPVDRERAMSNKRLEDSWRDAERTPCAHSLTECDCEHFRYIHESIGQPRKMLPQAIQVFHSWNERFRPHEIARVVSVDPGVNGMAELFAQQLSSGRYYCGLVIHIHLL